MEFKEFFYGKPNASAVPSKILVEVPEPVLRSLDSGLIESTRATVGRYTARRDPPHFQGDEYHAHVEIPGGYEVAWGVSGARRHASKFPSEIPGDAKAAVAKILKVDVALLESFRVTDEDGSRYLLVELKKLESA